MEMPSSFGGDKQEFYLVVIISIVNQYDIQ